VLVAVPSAAPTKELIAIKSPARSPLLTIWNLSTPLATPRDIKVPPAVTLAGLNQQAIVNGKVVTGVDVDSI